jgi:hypothetical protein
MPQSVERHLGGAVNSQAYSPFEVIDATMSAVSAGAKSPQDVERLGTDAGYLRLTEKKRHPSATTVWRFLQTAHELPTRQGGKLGEAVLPEESRVLRGLESVRREQVQAVQNRLGLKIATVDLDATIIESHKEEALPHYNGGRGYQPWVALWVEANLIVADEFREGNVPAATNALAQVKKAIGALPSGIETINFRADSALDSPKALRWLERNVSTFAVSADMTQELRAAIEKLPEEAWRRLTKREEYGLHLTDCDIAEVEYVTNQQTLHKDSQPFRYIVIRKREQQGTLFATGEQRFYLAMVTNEWKSSAQDMGWWHKEKCGTIELTHKILKEDLAAGVMPCSRFQANAAWFRLNVLTYNLISAMKQLALPAEMEKVRPVTLRYRFLNLAGKIVQHARQLILKLPWTDDVFKVYRQAREKLWSALSAPPALPPSRGSRAAIAVRRTLRAGPGPHSGPALAVAGGG